MAPVTTSVTARVTTSVTTLTTHLTAAKSLPVAVITLITLQLLRLAGADMDPSVTGVAVTVAGFAAAALTGPLMWWLGPARAFPGTAGALALAWLVLQVPAVRVGPVVAAACALAFAALILAVRRRAAPGPAARAIALAAGADAALRLLLDSWDPAWRGGLVGWAAALVLAALLGALAWDAHRRPVTAAPGGADLRLALLGPALALYGGLLASPGFVASQGGLSLTAAGLWIAAGTLLGLWLLSPPLALPPRPSLPPRLRLRLHPRLRSVAAPGALAAAVLVLLAVPPLAPLAALVGLAALPAVLARALSGPGLALTTGRGMLTDLTLAGGAAGLSYALLVLPDQLHIPSAQGLLSLAGAVLFACAAWPGPGAGRDPDRAASPAASPAADPVTVAAPLPRAFSALVLAVALLAAPPLANAARTGPASLPTDTAGGVYKLLTWNVHGAVDGDGDIAPDEVLDVIRDSGAHVVVLQEVPRGWTGAGGLDLAAWLERHLDAEAVWAPAEDRQFGNLILTSLPVVDAATGSLPRGEGRMDRSYATVTVRLTDGETARITTTHLEGSDRGTRREQLAEVLRVVGDDPHGVLAGDLNARPGSAEIDTVRDAGFRSAQDEAGDPGRATQREPRRRVDWIFGGEQTAFAGFRLLETPGSRVSDHVPLAVTVWLD